MPHGIVLVTAPAVEPVTLSEAKQQIGIPATNTNSDAIINQCLLGARQFVEDWLGRSAIETEWREAFDKFPSEFRPMRSPLISVTSITYTDTDGDSQTVAAADYVVDVYADPGRITRAYGVAWPTPKAQINTVLLTYKAGYGTAPSDVPKTLKQVVLMLAAHWFDTPEGSTKAGAANMVPFSVRELLTQLETGALP